MRHKLRINPSQSRIHTLADDDEDSEHSTHREVTWLCEDVNGPWPHRALYSYSTPKRKCYQEINPFFFRRSDTYRQNNPRDSPRPRATATNRFESMPRVELTMRLMSGRKKRRSKQKTAIGPIPVYDVEAGRLWVLITLVLRCFPAFSSSTCKCHIYMLDVCGSLLHIKRVMYLDSSSESEQYQGLACRHSRANTVSEKKRVRVGSPKDLRSFNICAKLRESIDAKDYLQTLSSHLIMLSQSRWSGYREINGWCLRELLAS